MSHLFTRGRVGRIECIKHLIIGTWLFLSATALLNVVKALGTSRSPQSFLQNLSYHSATALVWCVIAFSLLYVTTTLIARLHDQNKTGWFLLISFVPLINLVLYFAIFFIPGDQSRNRYGRPERRHLNLLWPILALAGFFIYQRLW